jgi:hypothetical protein
MQNITLYNVHLQDVVDCDKTDNPSIQLRFEAHTVKNENDETINVSFLTNKENKPVELHLNEPVPFLKEISSDHLYNIRMKSCVGQTERTYHIVEIQQIVEDEEESCAPCTTNILEDDAEPYDTDKQAIRDELLLTLTNRLTSLHNQLDQIHEQIAYLESLKSVLQKKDYKLCELDKIYKHLSDDYL